MATSGAFGRALSGSAQMTVLLQTCTVFRGYEIASATILPADAIATILHWTYVEQIRGVVEVIRGDLVVVGNEGLEGNDLASILEIKEEIK